LAFAVQGAISVALGNVFAFLPPRVIQMGVGFLLLLFAVHFWRESKRKLDMETTLPTNANSLRLAFTVVFLAEWGDVSQLAIASYSAQHQERFTIFISAALALWLIAALAVFVGSRLHRMVSTTRIQRFAAYGFVVAGLYLAARGLWGGP
jgi:putative Ca2+/H+ antiporter (TMEM165/GDT1 family)